MGTEANPNALDRVILTLKTGGPPPGGPVNQASAPAAQPAQPEVVQEATDDFAGDDDSSQPDDQQAQDQQPADEQQAQQQPAGAFGQPGQPNVRSPQQLLLELQQRQAQQQQQNGGAPVPGAPQGFPIPPGAEPGANNPPQ
jgi:hypothetical protein